ncbi:MAG: aminodeoxychorismate synthase, component I, partial [Gammaproteobacteria bacterium]
RRGRLPAALAVRVRGAVVRERGSGRCWVAAEAPALLEAVAADAEAAAGLPPPRAVPRLAWEEDCEGAFLEGVRRVLAYIREGDVFQVNLSRLWRARLPGALAADPSPLYARLRASNPAPFAGLARLGEGAWVLSSSPERLLRLGPDGEAETRPIAGTRPRGLAEEDARLSAELLAHPKERAEHVMLIDLERNDLGRVCRPGTVRVAELMALESYAHVHHIVSSVRGRLRPEVGPGAAVRAVFPGGTITGCPKVRCMEIIAELEGEARGAYTGSMGYLGLDGRLDLNILIRSLELWGEELHLRAGAGIVADSEPERELAETRAKARGLLLALDPDLDPGYGRRP